jgi:A/G-specific adenine glycosylase
MMVLTITALPEQKIIFSHLEWHLEGYLVNLKEEGEGYRFAPLKEIRESFSVASAFQGYLALLEKEQNEQQDEGGESCR